MANKVCVYKEEYKPNKIYYDRHRTALALMCLDDGSLVVGKGTKMPVAFSSMSSTADNDVEQLRIHFLDNTNRFKETLRFDTFTDLQRFLWGTTDNIPKKAVLLNFPDKIYVGSNKWGIVYCTVNTNVEVPEGYIYVNDYETIYNNNLVEIPVIDSWVGFKLSLEEFNESYKEYDGEFTYMAEINYTERNANEKIVCKNRYSYFIYYRVMINGIEQGCGDLIITTDTKITDFKTIEGIHWWLDEIKTQICKEITAVLNASNDYRIITNDNIIISNYKFIN